MVLRNASELAKDAVSKSLIIFKILLEKVFKLSLHHRVLDFGAMFMLIPSPNYRSTKKQGDKHDLIRPVSPNSFEVVLILLAEPVAIQV